MLRRPQSLSLTCSLVGLLAILGGSTASHGAPSDQEPLLRIEAGGPTSYVTALAFTADGRTLYSGGWDKVVQVWGLDTASGQFQLSDRATFRIPIGPGTGGNINAIALSEDGRYLAVAGRTVITGEAGFRERGIIWPKAGTMTDAMRADEGLIYLFDTQSREVRTLRGHKGPVLALAFAPRQGEKAPQLVSVGLEGEESDNRRGVVYLWNATDGKYVDGHFLPAPRGMRPPIAAWHTGKDDRALRVALALGNQTVLWDVAPRKLITLSEGTNQFIASHFPAGNRLLTSAAGGLQTWSNLGAGQTPTKGVLWQLPPQQVAVSVVSFAQAGKERIAAISWEAGTDQSRLVLLDAETGATLGAPVPLWKERKQPTLAVDQGGSRLAVAGSPDHHLLVYSISDLLEGKTTPQTLQSVGSSFGSVEFVQRDDRPGLRLADRERSLVFDFTTPGIASDPTNWESANASPGAWQVTLRQATDTTPAGLAIRGPEGASAEVMFTPKQILPQTAIFPGTKERPLPIIALSVLEEGQPKLWIIDSKTGDKLRELTAHSDLITGLAFSADGRLLASTSRDQTVAVWSLTDLGETVGKLGGLPGVTVESDQSGLRLASADSATFPIPVGAKILGTVDANGQRIPFESALNFYYAFSSATPGSTVRLEIEEGARKRVVPVTVGQGTDERKPLFSLFFAEPEKDRQQSWIGWNPVGPYESSGSSADRLLGWHFNTDLPSSPTAFALAKEYRKTYYQENLLKDLVEKGTYQPPPPPPPPPAPQMSLWLREEGADEQLFGGAGFIRLHQPKGILQLSVHKFPMEHIAKATLFVDGVATEGLKRISETEWQAALNAVPWGNKVHDLRVTLTTDETPAREFSQEVAAAIQPEPPAIKIANPVDQTQVRDAAFRLRLDVQPTSGEAKVKVVQTAAGQAIDEKTVTTDKAGEVGIDFTLRPGSNSFDVTAVRPQPLAGYEAKEESRLSYAVSFDEKPTAPPRVTITKVVEGESTDDAYERPAGARIVVMQPKVRVFGTIVGTEKLTAAEYFVEPEKRATLESFSPGQVDRFEFSQLVDLKPGSQEIVVVGKSERSLPGEARVAVYFQPPLPDVHIESPVDGTVLTDSKEVELVGGFDSSTGVFPYQVMILVNGQALPRPPVIDEKEGKIRAKLQLEPGDNRLQFRVSNEWNVVSKTSPVSVSYRRPPEIVAVKAPTVSERPLVDIQATVTSPKDSPLTRLEINGRPIPLEAVTLATVAGQEATWQIDAKNIPLQTGANELEILAWNREGASPTAGTVKLNYNQAPAAKANAEFISPRLETVVTKEQLPVAIRIRSESPILSVDLMRGRQLAFTAPSTELNGLAADSTGVYEYSTSIPVDLDLGANVLELRALNDGGEAVRPLTISRLEKPVRIVVDRVISKKTGKAHVPSARTDNELVIDREELGSELQIFGRVLWNDSVQRTTRNNLVLRLFANGFQQMPVPLREVAGASGERSFVAEVLLNREGANLIEMDLLGVGEDQATRSRLHVQSAAPTAVPQLHLLIVGMGKADKEGLLKEALTALDAKPSGKGQYASPAFAKVHCYGPLTGFVGPERIVSQLERIRFNLKVHKSVNDVVMMYYQGGESVNEKGRFYLLTSATKYDPDLEASALSGEDLTTFFDMTPGAHLLLLDVARTQPGEAVASQDATELVSQWPEESRIGLLRNTWLDGPVAPDDANLLLALREAIPQSSTGRLQEVSEALRGRFDRLTSKYSNSLSFFQFVPDQLEDLLVK